jgi:hypothetical protein
MQPHIFPFTVHIPHPTPHSLTHPTPPPLCADVFLTALFQDNERRPDIEYGTVSNDNRCGLNAARRNVAQRRIVGGDEAGFGSFPWQAYVRIGESSSRCDKK